MKFIIPVKPMPDETVNSYIDRCSLWLLSFKQFLRKHLKADKLACRKVILRRQPNITWIKSCFNYNIMEIVNLYITRLQCFYDSFTGNCYYMVPNYIRCPYTLTSLNTVIRTLEYGSINMVPLYWLRPAYQEFIESTVITKNKCT